MLDNILVPLDGTPLSEAALPYAEALAARTGAQLTLIRAAHGPILAVGRPEAQFNVISEAEEYLAKLAEEARGRGFTIATGVPYGLSPAAWLVEEITLRNADMIVIGTHDRVGLDHLIHGSVAQAVVSHATVPVLLIRSADGLRPVEHFHSREPVFIVPLDGSDIAEAGLPEAKKLARALGGRLVLVGVIPEPGQPVVDQWGIGTYVGANHERLRTDAQDYLWRVAAQVEADGILTQRAVRQGDPAAQIVHASEQYNAAAVVMATHGRTGIGRMLMGSIAGRVLHNSPCPVLVVRPPRLRAAEEPVAVREPAAGTA